jgi:hypothetical protein
MALVESGEFQSTTVEAPISARLFKPNSVRATDVALTAATASTTTFHPEVTTWDPFSTEQLSPISQPAEPPNAVFLGRIKRPLLSHRVGRGDQGS